MQLPGDFLVTLTREETKAILAHRLKLFVELNFKKDSIFTQDSFSMIINILVIEPRPNKKVIQEIFDQFLKDAIIENIPGNPMWFHLNTRPTIEKSNPIIEIRPAL